MAGLTIERAEAMLEVWLAAETGLASSQSYTINVEGNSRTLTRADLEQVGERIKYWNGIVVSLSRRANGRSRTRTIVN